MIIFFLKKIVDKICGFVSICIYDLKLFRELKIYVFYEDMIIIVVVIFLI